MVWPVWVYTTWVTNWLDPQRTPVQLMLVALMLGSLVLSAALPRAFEDRGLWVGAAYAVMQVGRSMFAIAGLRGDRLQRNFQRILAWCIVSGALAVLGGFAHDGARAGLWIATIAVDLLGGVVGFYTPGLGRCTTEDWTISGSHMAERCQAFVLIALGESVVVIGATLADLYTVSGAEVGAFVAAFLGVVALWWVSSTAAPRPARRRSPSRPTRGALAARPTTSSIRSWSRESSSRQPPTKPSLRGSCSAGPRCSWPVTRHSKRPSGETCR
jgi:low temperature requirement protein LtrA